MSSQQSTTGGPDVPTRAISSSLSGADLDAAAAGNSESSTAVLATPLLGAADTIRVGTRKSPLALRQTDIVVAALRALHPQLSFVVQGMSVAGDRDKYSPLSTMGKGLWTTELEDGLRSRALDMVVHSLKDVPTTLPDGCTLGCIFNRDDPLDALVVRHSTHGHLPYESLAALPTGSIVGTSSVRRQAQLRVLRPDLRFADIRGNVDTRLRKLDDESGPGEPFPGEPFTALVLAAAGLRRMGYGHRITQLLDHNLGIMYAVGQGALGVEIRSGDSRIAALLTPLGDQPTTLACVAERSLMRALEAGCSVPLGVVSSWLPVTGDHPPRLHLRASVTSIDGIQHVEMDEATAVATHEEAEGLGKRLAERMVHGGASTILDVINGPRAVHTAV